MSSSPLLQSAKIIVIGDDCVGKTSIISRFIEDRFTYNTTKTMGIDFQSKKVQINNEPLKAQVWDSVGHSYYKTITRSFFRNTVGVIIAFDVTRESTLDNASYWLSLVQEELGEDIPKILVGNKADMDEKKMIPKQNIEDTASIYGLDHFLVSSKSGEGIEQAFKSLLLEVRDKGLLGSKSLEVNNSSNEKEQKRKYSNQIKKNGGRIVLSKRSMMDSADCSKANCCGN